MANLAYDKIMACIWHVNTWQCPKTCSVTQNVVHLILHPPWWPNLRLQLFLHSIEIDRASSLTHDMLMNNKVESYNLHYCDLNLNEWLTIKMENKKIVTPKMKENMRFPSSNIGLNKESNLVLGGYHFFIFTSLVKWFLRIRLGVKLIFN
jgi:hypothetical protein